MISFVSTGGVLRGGPGSTRILRVVVSIPANHSLNRRSRTLPMVG